MGTKWEKYEKLDRQMLYRVVAIFKESADVVDVEVYGSLSRTEQGNDLDLILIVDDIEKENLFYKKMIAELSKPKEERDFLAIADEILSDGGSLLRRANILTQNRMNILVHEKSWKSRIPEIMPYTFHHDPDFLSSISTDAVSTENLN